MTFKMIPHYFKGRKEKEGREKKKSKNDFRSWLAAPPGSPVSSILAWLPPRVQTLSCVSLEIQFSFIKSTDFHAS